MLVAGSYLVKLSLIWEAGMSQLALIVLLSNLGFCWNSSKVTCTTNRFLGYFEKNLQPCHQKHRPVEKAPPIRAPQSEKSFQPTDYQPLEKSSTTFLFLLRLKFHPGPEATSFGGCRMREWQSDRVKVFIAARGKTFPLTSFSNPMKGASHHLFSPLFA